MGMKPRSRVVLVAKSDLSPPWMPKGWLTVHADGWTMGVDAKFATPRSRVDRVRETFLDEMEDLVDPDAWEFVELHPGQEPPA